MCRMILFGGRCPRCTGDFSWEDLTQHLSCLEAKNVGVFGHCRRGVQLEEHTFDQECDACQEATVEADEGYFDEDLAAVQTIQHHGMEKEKPAKNKGKGKSRATEDDDGRRSKKQRTS
ncbi:hypothetical protein QBC47DRAFT_406403 [Echria macrotheca]|uniref:Uncharacterized protein n=1 Tax=Echria macrotheca TaxID=438768 RepID=A0AAJ0B3R7_9PEZI|nr:hypothetical protein QBC47DRAFT_406403 [Echria macrotheca]